VRRSIAIAGLSAAALLTVGAAQPAAPLALPAFTEGHGRPLVMLGGGTPGAAEFAPHARILADAFRVVRLQTLNVDRSERHQPLPAGYSLKLESAAMARALDELGLTGPLDIVGHSFGALVALDFALDHPDRVRTLVLAEPPAFWAAPREELMATRDMRAMFELSRELDPVRDPTDDQLVRFRCVLGTCGMTPPAANDPARDDWMARRAALRGLSAVANHSDSTARLRAFRRPVLIVTGTTTVSFHRRINDILAATLPRAERAELPGGHGAVATAPDQFIATLRAFLARHPN
jgi:pimeloyl-ACP methyl ester carboxylesterase